MNESAPSDEPRRVWALASYRSGENTQILALADALGLPYEVKRLRYRALDFVPGLLRLSTLAGIDREASSPLSPPWPDLLISAGMRNEPVCRWIKRQSPATRLVHLGRTWADTAHFDLIVTTPQYRLPHRANILHNAGTLQHLDRQRLDRAAQAWQSRLAHLSQPYITVLIGGRSGPYSLGRRTVRRLATALDDLHARRGGSLLISTSARTPPAAIDALATCLRSPTYLYRWRPQDPDNPYLAFLALAREIVVTSDSVAMLSEACATGKPVHIFDMDGAPRDLHPGAFLYRLLMRLGPRRLSRDVGLVHRRFIEEGRAVWLGQDPPKTPPPTPLADMERTVSTIRERLLARKQEHDCI